MPSKNWAIPWRRTIEAELSNLAAIRRFHKAAKTGLGVADPAMLKIRRAVASATANVILHGYNGQGGPLDIEVKREGPDLLILLCDQAPPFDPTGIPPPDITQPLTERRMGGMGLKFIRQATDELRHRPRPTGGNGLTLIKKGIIK